MRLVTVAHGTRKASGNAIAVSLTAAAGELLGVPAVASYVELSAPLLPAVLASSSSPTVVVPLLLSTGFHLRHDLPEMLRAAAGPVDLGPSLGPDPLIASAQVERLLSAGAKRGQPLVMVAAGSTDPLATRDQEAAADLLSGAWGACVRIATLSGLGRRPVDVVRAGDAVSPYLLSPGFFADRAREESLSAGASAVADVIGVHPDVVALVAARARDVIRNERPSALSV